MASGFPAEHKGRRVVVVHTVDEWRRFLLDEGATSPAIWLTVWKKAAPEGRPRYEDLVCEALCHGWIDSTINGFDELCTLLLMAPRKPGSMWSAPNKERVERVTAEGRMRPTGQAVIDAAKADGSWSILDSVDAMLEPDDLVAAIDAAGVRSEWESWSRSRRRMVLTRLVLAKTDRTRTKRIDEAIAELSGSTA
jgi:uncharacterized protein YdeI (YjbR/CyaY-like superfamily)